MSLSFGLLVGQKSELQNVGLFNFIFSPLYSMIERGYRTENVGKENNRDPQPQSNRGCCIYIVCFY